MPYENRLFEHQIINSPFVYRPTRQVFFLFSLLVNVNYVCRIGRQVCLCMHKQLVSLTCVHLNLAIMNLDIMNT